MGKSVSKRRSARTSSFALDVSGSKCLSDGRYNGKTKELAVTFARDGSQYIYQDVPRSVAKQIESGEDFNDLIRDQYDYS